MFGWPRTEALGRELAELVIPERDHEAHRQGLRRYAETGMARVLNKRIEMSALHREGREFPVELAITPIGFGEELVFSAFIRDITDRARGEAALRESELRFRTTANAAPVLIWMSGPDGHCTWFNQRWLDFVGRAIEQELGDGWCDNLHPADFDRVLDTRNAAFDARRPYEMEYRLQRDDGAWRWLLERGTPNLALGDVFEGFIGTCIDITEHRETVEALRESRARFKTLTESLPQMIWTCTRDGYTDYLSRQWLDYTGRSESQQLGRGWLEQVHPEDRDKVATEWARVVGSGDAFDLSSGYAASTASIAGSRPARCRCAIPPDASSSGSVRTPTSRISWSPAPGSKCSSSACNCSIGSRTPSACTRSRARCSRSCCAVSRRTSASTSAAYASTSPSLNS